jgi:SAM-dependent methyltransferase
MRSAVTSWTYRCPHCGLWRSTLTPGINVDGHALSEEDRFRGLAPIRLANFRTVFEHLSIFTPLESLRVLDVGCAYGWFLEAAMARRMTAVGLEPDARTAQIARAKGLDVVQGYFPDSLPDAASFDVVVFNDVLEHIPGVNRILAASGQALKRNGFLVLNLPSSSGSLFRLASIAARLGWLAPWKRLWQLAFPSPHVYYFNRTNLDVALQAHGFHRVAARSTRVFHPKGLWSRLKLDKRSHPAANMLLYLVLLAAYPFYRVLGSSDTELLICRYDGRPPASAPSVPQQAHGYE